MSQINTNPKNASFDDNMIPSLLIKDVSTNETVAVTGSNGSINVGWSIIENPIPTVSPTSVLTDFYDVVKAPGDIIAHEGNTNGVRYLKISQNPFVAGTETMVTTKQKFKMSMLVDAGLNISQRLLGYEQALEVVGCDSDGTVTYVTQPASIAISGNITVATNVWTINTTLAHGLVPNDRIVLTGNTDSRLNVGPVRVTAIVNKTQFTITSTLANATYTAGGTVTIADPLDNVYDGANFLFDTATATQAINASRTAGNTKCENAAYTVSTTAASNTPTLRTEAFTPTSRYTLQLFPDYNVYTNLVVDSVTTNLAGVVRTNQIADNSRYYKPRVRVKNLPNASIRVGGNITAAVKTGTTTATITTSLPHGLTTSDFIQIQGIRDIAVNFPNLIAPTAVASVINANNFTVILWPAVTASSLDGIVWKMNGLTSIPNATTTRGITNIIVSGDEANFTISGAVVGTINVGDTFYVAGLAPALSAYEIAYVCLDNTGSTIIARPQSGTIANIGSTATGGMYVRCIDTIIHWARAKQESRQAVEIVGSDQISDVSRSTKVTLVGSPAISGTVTANTTETALIAPTVATLNSAATTNATSVKATAGNIYNIALSNNGAAAAFFKLYNKATAPTVGTDIPLDVITVGAGSYVNIDSARGIRFATGIAYAITNLIADADTTAVAAGQVKVHISYI